MLLAVVLDCYMEVKGRVGAASETLPEQAEETLRRWWQNRKGTRLPVAHILEQLQRYPVGEEGKISVVQFCNMVPGLDAGQASRLLRGAVGLWEDTEGQSLSLSESIIFISAIDTYVRNINRSIGLLLSVKGSAFATQPTVADKPTPSARPTPVAPPAEEALLGMIQRHRGEQREDFERVLARLGRLEAAPSGAGSSSYDIRRVRQADFRRSGRRPTSGTAPGVVCTEACGLTVPVCAGLVVGNGDSQATHKGYARTRQRTKVLQITG
mmetsp:Transcript_89266/g.204105  ORF Transcript_89266/g.204105 Transcript_89266/m.204105 type:complete len:268 (-) Transcript_89266:150-953(-)